MKRNESLVQLTDEQLIEMAEAINSEAPGLNAITKDLCIKIFNSDTLVQYIGLGALLSLELSQRLKEKL
jgi:hypothetical protein